MVLQRGCKGGGGVLLVVLRPWLYRTGLWYLGLEPSLGIVSPPQRLLRTGHQREAARGKWERRQRARRHVPFRAWYLPCPTWVAPSQTVRHRSTWAAHCAAQGPAGTPRTRWDLTKTRRRPLSLRSSCSKLQSLRHCISPSWTPTPSRLLLLSPLPIHITTHSDQRASRLIALRRLQLLPLIETRPREPTAQSPPGFSLRTKCNCARLDPPGLAISITLLHSRGTTCVFSRLSRVSLRRTPGCRLPSSVSLLPSLAIGLARKRTDPPLARPSGETTRRPD